MARAWETCRPVAGPALAQHGERAGSCDLTVPGGAPSLSWAGEPPEAAEVA